jgi:hypothetical protein
MSADQGMPSRQGETRWYLPQSLRLRQRANTALSVVAGVAFVLFRFTGFCTLLLIVVAAVIGVLYVQSVKIAWRRRPPFCIHCGYDLQGLPDNSRCPECGEPYTLAGCSAYQRDPVGYRRRWEKKEFDETTQIVGDFLAKQRERRKRP